ncbi:MAG: YkvA family protein [Thermoleophilaceae bacterium]
MPGRVRELARVVPQLGTLFLRLARDRRVPPLRRLSLIVLGAYLVSPIDLIPDFIPVIGQLDDAAIAAVALRGVVRAAGPELVAEHWPGTTRSLNVVLRLAGYS